MTTLKLLDKSTIQSLHSGQVIVDVEAIVKELIENALDANATAIDFVFKNDGLDSIQVIDNGDGIAENDRLYIAKRHYTSKMQVFQDLERIETYGFRGEAINAICAISDGFTIMTKTKQDTIGKQYTIDKHGTISNEKPTNAIATSGTLIVIQKPFYDLPVRRQIAIKQSTQYMKKIQDLLLKYALAHPNVRFSSQSNNKPLWIKPVTPSIESTMTTLFDAALTDMLEHFIETDLSHPTLSVDAILPKANSDPSVILKGPDHVYIYVNNRPIHYVKSELKDLVTMIRNRYRDTIGLAENTTSKRTPFIYINIKISPDEYDVNVEPNKTTILLHNKQLVFDLIENKILNKVYPSNVKQFFQPIIPDEHVAPTHIPTDNNEQDWSFNMDDSITEIDELLSDEEETNDAVTPTHTLDRYLTKEKGVVHTPILTSHVPIKQTPFIPKKRMIQTLDEEEEESSPPPPVQQRAHVPRIDTNNAPISMQKPAPPQPKPVPTRKPPIQMPVHRPLKDQPPGQLWNTRNQTMTLDCNIESIKANYPRRKEILSETYRIPIDEYLNTNHHRHSKTTTSLIQFPKGSPHHHLSLYKKCAPSVYQLGVVKLTSLSMEATLHTLLKEYKLVCKKPLERPVQIQMSHDDPLCPILISLPSKEHFVNDDFHGQDRITYSEIVDETVLNNGFKVRWRKDLCSGNLIIQFTSIYSLGSGYGPSDFRELLDLKLKKSTARPAKVIAFIQSIAQQIHNSNQSSTLLQEHQLEQALSHLTWKTQDNWKLGYGSSSNKVLACILTD